jgi:hypothetical protein
MGNLKFPMGNAKKTVVGVSLTMVCASLTKGSMIQTMVCVTLTKGKLILTTGNLILTMGKVILTEGKMILTTGKMIFTVGKMTLTTVNVTFPEPCFCFNELIFRDFSLKTQNTRLKMDLAYASIIFLVSRIIYRKNYGD